MPVQNYGLISLPMVGGVDTRTEPRSILPPKLTTLLNGRFGKPGTLRKRQGYQKLLPGFSGTTTVFGAPKSKRILNDGTNLYLVGDSGQLHVRSESGWTNNKVPSPAISNTLLTYPPVNPPTNAFNVRATDQVTNFGVTFCAMEVWDGTTAQVRVFAFDAVTGEELTLQQAGVATAPGAELVVTGFSPRLLALGTLQVALFYATVAGSLLVALIDRNAMAFVTTQPLWLTVTVAADLNTTTPVYDVAAEPGRFLVVYNTTTANTVKFGYVESSGAVGAMTTQGTTAAPECVSCAVDASFNFYISWTRANRIEARPFDQSFTALTAVATLNSTAASHTNLASMFVGANCFFFWEFSAAATYNRSIGYQFLTIAGSGSGTPTWIANAGMASRPFMDPTNRLICLLTVTDTPIQPTYFIFAGSIAGVELLSDLGTPRLIGRVFPDIAGGVTVRPHLPSYDVAAKGMFIRLKTQIVSNARGPDGKNTSIFASQFAGQVGRRVGISFDDDRLYQYVVANGVIYTNGSIMHAIDGVQQVENNFLMFNELTTIGPLNSTGSIAPGTYSYRIYPEWVNSLGQREQGTMAADLQITIGAPNNTVQITGGVNFLSQTLRNTSFATGVANLAIYRTQNNGTVFYRVSSADPADATLALNGFATGAFQDGLTDAQIATREIDYRAGGVLDNLPPPPCTVLCAGNSRLFCAGFEDPNLIWASKQFSTGEPVAWNDALTIVVPTGDGPISALAVLNDELIVFRRNAIYTIGGDGPNNLGVLGQFDPPRIVSQAIGCSNPRSIVRIAEGIVFQSQRGIYLLGNDRALTYIGADVEAYNSETITSAVALEDRGEIRFLSANRCLVLDLLQQQWAVWTIHGTSATLHNGAYVYMAGDGDVRREVDGFFLDDVATYSMVIETPWMHLAGVQGIQRVRRALFLGDYHGSHKPLLSFAYNYEPFYQDRQTWDPGAVVGAQLLGGNGGLLGSGKTFGGNDASGRVSTNVYQFRAFPARPRCMAIKIRIEDMASAGVALGEGYSLSEIALEVALRPGAFNPGSDRVTS